MDKTDYKSFYEKHSLPIQFSPDWMNAVCIKGSWDFVIAKDVDGNAEGILVYHIRKYRGFTLILMPPMTFYNGICFFYRNNIKEHSKIAFENKVAEKLLNALPKHDLFYQQCSPDFNNAYLFFWKKYNLSFRYTYRLNLMLGEKVLFDNLKGNVRRNIKKASQKCTLEEASFDVFWKGLKDSYKQRQNPFRKELLERIVNNLSSDKTSLTLAKDKATGETLAGSLIVHDKTTSYYVCGFYNPVGKQTGALSCLLWENITSSKSQVFDFEGSMLKDIEFFFRSFGGKLTPHYRIWKINHPVLKLASKFKKLPFMD